MTLHPPPPLPSKRQPTMTGKDTQSGQQYIDLYNEARQTIFSHGSGVMNALRDKAFADFCQAGFPSQKVERYKYTDMAGLFAPDYGLNLSRLHIPADPYKAFSCDVPNLSTLLYFMVNDQFHAPSAAQHPQAEAGGDAHPVERLPEGVLVGSMHELFSLPPDGGTAAPRTELAQLYGRLADTAADAVTALNTMLAQDGLVVYVPRGVKVEKTIQVINMLKSPFTAAANATAQRTPTGAPPPFMVNRRVLIALGEGAELKMLFCDHAADDSDFLATQVTEVLVGEGARLQLHSLEETHNKSTRVSNVYIDQRRDSQLVYNVITLHNGTTRNMLDLNLNGEGAACRCYGGVIADKRQHVDNNTLITHQAAHCTSSELYKYVLDGQATGAFAGRVLVQPGAQQTVSQMTNKNLCASREARMYTQPMLEIYADDVKCAHGSTVGQLNDQALFYMRQRGVSEKEARTLLQVAFINHVIDQIDLAPLRDRLHYLVEKRFRGELNKCEGCRLCR